MDYSLNFPNGPCPFAGYQCEGNPKGSPVTGLGCIDPDGQPWYTVEPDNKFFNRCGIIFYTDSRGIGHDSRMLADQFSNAGYHVVVINNAGRYLRSDTPYTDYRIRQPDEPRPTNDQIDRMHTRAEQWMRNLRVNKFGAVGYGNGGQRVLRLAAFDDTKRVQEGWRDLPVTNQVEAVFISTPSGTYLEMYQWSVIPVSVAFADDDSTLDRDARRTIEEGLLNSGVPYQITLYSHVGNGFAQNRAVESNAGHYGKQQAFIQAVMWMHEHLFMDRQRGGNDWDTRGPPVEQP